MVKLVMKIIVICLILAISASSENEYFDSYFETYYSSNSFLSDKYYFTPDNPYPYPSYGAVQRTSKLFVTLSSLGELGALIREPFTNTRYKGLDFPSNSNISYLNIASLWVGGIINNDTLVSVTYSKDIYPSGLTIPYNRYIHEFFPVNAYTEMKSLEIDKIDSQTIVFQANYVDTFTYGVPHVFPITYDYSHTPLNLSITQKSYTKNITPYKNIIILDYTIKNIGTEIIKQAYIGIYLDADICGFRSDTLNELPQGVHTDDLAGSFRDISTAYMFDNDGDLDHDNLFNYQSPLDGIGVRHIRTYPHVADTNFNWWANVNEDFGPRQAGTPEDPFFDFGDGYLGTPNGDINKYYMLSHHEWDYDQIFTATKPHQDTTWLLPDSLFAHDYADGYDSRTLLSIGPFNLHPDSSIRSIFALFIGEYIHTDPDNANNLQTHQYQTYYDNLFFDIFKDNAEKTKVLAGEILDPMFPPQGLKVDYLYLDTVSLLWNDWVFPEVTGYNIYLKRIPDSQLFSPQMPAGDIDFNSLECETVSYSTSNNYITITNISSTQLYLAVVANKSSSGESHYSKPVVIGIDNPAIEVSSVTPLQKYTPFMPDSASITISWEPSPDSNIQYYKIYKTTDSILAANRYYPFINYNTNLENYEKQKSLEINGTIQFYYAISVYDSVSADLYQYTDINPNDNAYYWITAVSELNYESKFSSLIKTERVEPSIKEILVILGSGYEQHDYVLNESIENYYRNLLSGYTYDIYNWFDSNLVTVNCPSGYCVRDEDITKYKLIIIEEFPSPKIVKENEYASETLLPKLIDFNREIIYFGMPSGPFTINLSNETEEIFYDESSFARQYMGIKASFYKPWKKAYNVMDAVDSLAGFKGAKPFNNNLPVLEVSGYTSNMYKSLFQQLFNNENCLPLTPVFNPEESAKILYTYESLYPETSELQDLPCGILNKYGNGKIYSFSFHLWGIQQNQARALIDNIVGNIGQNNIPTLLPSEVQLSQNYPNPFNPHTVITFTLPEQMIVSLEIYNILGQKVTTLLNAETISAGINEVEWNGRNNNGYPVASGIYFYRLTADDNVISKKMMLLK